MTFNKTPQQNRLPQFLAIIHEIAKAICRHPDKLSSRLVGEGDDCEIDFKPDSGDCGFLIGAGGRIKNAFTLLADQLSMEYGQIRVTNTHIEDDKEKKSVYQKLDRAEKFDDDIIIKPLSTLCGDLFPQSRFKIEGREWNSDMREYVVAFEEGGIPRQRTIEAIGILMNAIGSANGMGVKRVKFESY